MVEILIVDDDPKICMILSELIGSMGYTPCVAYTVEDARNLASGNRYDLILLDLEFPVGNGLQILPELLKTPSAPEVIIITGTGDACGAELAFKYGAWGYIQKPFILADIALTISRALQYHQEKGIARAPATLNRAEIIGESAPIQTCLEEVAQASAMDAGVLITGETGTGKELFARAIHANSNRGSRSFVTVDCGALPETLVESTLFGHERGAFTGADKKQDGLILQADGGTLFFDEIGDLPLTIQKALLRALQERRIRPLGGKQEIPVDFRLLSATNLNLDSMVREKRFRADLLFRIRAIEIKLPPLRDRGPDLQEIAIRTVQRLGRRYGIGLKGISPEFLESLGVHDWPGNVRELINVMEYALAAAKTDPTLFPKHLPPEFRTAQLDFSCVSKKETAMPMDDLPRIGEVFPSWSVFQETAEKDYLQQLMVRAGGSREKACRLSGISQSRLYGLLKKHNLSRFRSS